MPKNIFSVHNVSDEDVGVQGKRSNQTLQPGDRDTFRDIRNKNEVARKCVIHLNASRVYENMLEVDRGGDTDDGNEEAEEQEVVEDESELQDENEASEESDEADESEEDDEVETKLPAVSDVLSDFDYSDLQALAGNEDDIQGNASKDDIVDGLAEKYSYGELEAALNE